MILFHVPNIDSGDLRLWRRVLLPAYLLRRAGMSCRIITGSIAPADFPGATIVFCGKVTEETARFCRAAREAGLRVVLDIAGEPLNADAASVRSAVAAAHVVTTSHAAASEIPPGPVAAHPCLRTMPDLVGTAGAFLALAAFPGIGLRVLLDAARVRAVDAVRRLRGSILGRQGNAGEGPRIVWFGDGVGLNDEGGLGELLLAAGTLADLAQETPFRLRAVGRSRLLFRRTIARLPIHADFRRLTLATLAGDIRNADLCLLPGGDNGVRAAIAGGLGVPVLGVPVLGVPHAGAEASPQDLAPSDWQAALRALLANGGTGLGRARPRPTRIQAAEVAGPDSSAALAAWKAVLTADDPASRVASAKPAAPIARRLRVKFLLQQFQDLDLICPVAEAASACPDLEVSIAILSKIAVPASRRLGNLRGRDARIDFWLGRDVLAGRLNLAPGEMDVAVTASDGAALGARYASSFVRAANRLGAVTINIQHGLDNSGLTYGPSAAAKTVQFGSRFVLTWGGFDRLTEAANAETRAKVIPAGCPKRRLKRSDVPDFPWNGRPIIAVFENLHWRRYDDAYRQSFVQDLIATARAAPDFLFLLKPHMGGQWFVRAQTLQGLPDNLVVADPAAPAWRRFTADGFLAYAAGVITTPSTIALDAARYELPTALVAYGIRADNYAPLPRIERTEDWAAFVQQIRVGNGDIERVRAFRDAAILPGDAVARILDIVRLAAAGTPRAEIVAKLGVSLPAS